MADQAEIEAALVALALAALYPQGLAAPAAVGAPCRAYRGWPAAAVLEADLAAGMAHIAVLAVEGSLRLATRFPETWAVAEAPSPVLNAAVSGDVVTFSGAAAPGQVAGILAGAHAVATRTEADDTPAHVAARLAALLRPFHAVQLAGASLAVPAAPRLLARVVADRPARREIRRQTQAFRLACFCPTPALRDAVAATLDAALAARRFVVLDNGEAARLLLSSTATLDEARGAGVFRRDLVYGVEYATTEAARQAAMLFGELALPARRIVN
jgi:hypothetical protein